MRCVSGAGRRGACHDKCVYSCRGCPRRVRQVSGSAPTVGRQRGQIAQLFVVVVAREVSLAYDTTLGPTSRKGTSRSALAVL